MLVVEDEALVASHLECCLRDLGYEVACAGSGEEAIEEARRKVPHLALMDIRLAGALDGIETALELRWRFGVACVFLTAYADEATIERAKEAEPVGYLVKPFDERELRATLEVALRRISVERRLRERGRWQAAVLDVVRDPVILVDIAGRVTFVNRAAERMTGCNAGQAQGLRLQELLRGFEPQLVEQLKQGLRRVLLDKRPAEMASKPQFRQSESVYAAEALVPTLDEGGALTGAVLVFRDCTETEPAGEFTGSPAPAGQPCAPGSVDPQTGLPGRVEAERAIAQVHRQGSRAFAGVFVIDHFPTLVQRYGFSGAEEVLLFFSVHLAQNLTGPDQLFRWTGPAFVLLMERLDSVERVRRELAGLASVKLEKLLQMKTRTALVVVSAAWELYAIHVSPSPEHVARQIDAFVALHAR
ncbi:MAG: response regulator [Bryobacteraceae bacterium]